MIKEIKSPQRNKDVSTKVPVIINKAAERNYRPVLSCWYTRGSVFYYYPRENISRPNSISAYHLGKYHLSPNSSIGTLATSNPSFSFSCRMRAHIQSEIYTYYYEAILLVKSLVRAIKAFFGNRYCLLRYYYNLDCILFSIIIVILYYLYYIVIYY